MGGDSYGTRMKKEIKSAAFFRDVAAEILGTFLLVAVQIAVVMDPNTVSPNPAWTGNIVRIPLAMGFVVVILADGLGSFGGGNYNPAVSVALAINLRITVLRALFYIVAQMIGGVLAGLFVFGMSPAIGSSHGGFALTMLAPGVTPLQGVFMEAFATSLLVFTVLGSTHDARRDVTLPAVPIGLAVGCALLTAIPFTGASINPARSFGPAVVAQTLIKVYTDAFKDHWVYWVGPIVGSVIASAFYLALHKVDGKKVQAEREDNKMAMQMTDKTQL